VLGKPYPRPVSRWTGSWLSGPVTDADDDDQQWRGERLGLPASGPGSVAGFAPRLGAIFVDWLPCAIAALLLTTNPGTSALAIFAVLTVVSVTAFGRTPGHAVAGLRVAKLDGSRPGFGPAVIRTALLCLAIPALLTDADGRGLHDRAAGTVVLRTR
jgi:uncharacterized RDD family membrane protein YckC